MTLTIVIMTRNERLNIEGAVRSCAGLQGEILVVDHQSVDGTPELAASLGCRVVSEGLGDISLARNLALSEARGDWILFLDADERVTPGLASEIARHVADPPGSAASFLRRNVAFGRRMRFGPLWPDRVARLFPKGSVRWEGLVHERPVSGLPTARLKGHVLHHTYPDFRTYVEKQALYARLWARGASARGASATPFKAFTRAFLALLKMSVLKLGLLDGPAGWCLCWYYSGAYTLGKYLLLADMTGARHEDGGGGGAAQEAPDGGGAPEARAAGAAPEAPVTLAPEAQEDEAQGDGERLAGGVAGPGNGAGGG